MHTTKQPMLLSGILLSSTLIFNSGCTVKEYFVPTQPEHPVQRQTTTRSVPVVIEQQPHQVAVVSSPPTPPTSAPPPVAVVTTTHTTTTKLPTTPQPTVVQEEHHPVSVLEPVTTVYYEEESSQEPNPIQMITSSEPIEEECNDDVPIEESDCNRGEISPEELQNAEHQNIQETQDGVMHLLQSVQGKTVNIGERPNGFVFPNYPNKIIILEMFGKDCPHCLKEIPIIKKIKQRYPDQVEVIAIQSQERMSPHEARSYISKHRINYPIIEGEDATNLQYFIQNTYGWTGILPYTLIIKDGITEFSYPGEVPYQDLKRDIDSLL